MLCDVDGQFHIHCWAIEVGFFFNIQTRVHAAVVLLKGSWDGAMNRMLQNHKKYSVSH